MPENRHKKPFKSTKNSLIVYPGQGIQINKTSFGACKPPESGGVRGDCVGMTSAVARRFRQELITHRPKDGNIIANLTLTVPGSPLTIEEKNKVFNLALRYYFKKMGWGAYWRMEMQRMICQPSGLRRVHWHLILSMGFDQFPGDFRTVDRVTAAGFVRHLISQEWLRILDSLGDDEHVTNRGRMHICPRSRLPGAFRNAVHVDLSDTPQGRWLRYLADHASKKKSEQMARGYGRVWGFIGDRAAFEDVPGIIGPDMTERQELVFLHRLRRMMLRWIHDPRAPFGFRRGYENPAGEWGTSYWFGNTADIQRLADWVVANY